MNRLAELKGADDPDADVEKATPNEEASDNESPQYMTDFFDGACRALLFFFLSWVLFRGISHWNTTTFSRVEVGQIKSWMSNFRQNISAIEDSYGKYVTSVTNEQTKEASDKLDELIDDTNELTHKIRGLSLLFLLCGFFLGPLASVHCAPTPQYAFFSESPLVDLELCLCIVVLFFSRLSLIFCTVFTLDGLKKIEADTAKSKDASSETRIRVNMHNTLTVKFLDLMTTYQEAQVRNNRTTSISSTHVLLRIGIDLWTVALSLCVVAIPVF